MFKKHIKIMIVLEKILAESEEKLQLSMKKVLNKSLNTKNIFVMFFEWTNNDINFIIVDNNKKVTIIKDSILNEIGCNPLLPENLLNIEKEMNDEFIYNEHDMRWEDIFFEYEYAKSSALENWFMSCWDKAKLEYTNIPKTFLAMGDYKEMEFGNYTIDLDTKKLLENNERMKLLKSLRK